MNIHAILLRVRRNETGAALVEFAIVIPVLLLLLLGMVDLGKAYNYWIDGTHLSATGARWAAVNNNPGPGATLQDTIRQQADTPELRNGGTGSVPNPVQVCISFPNGTSNVGDPVRVTVNTGYTFLNFLNVTANLTNATISGSTIMRLEQKPTNFAAGCA